ncbi:hypothetical protein BDY21DRAFT_326494 [Lineolata rhizophorae]|uniref:Tyrosine--tRNA ligase n=1 Tax=Lineolata rhizophorae TaxID=578093 RepID=A0A6A6NRF2_9PEZI|nr:hypothetical protein BDY21DRAFT_326494 [Lineolata rhizophorae]
MTGAPSLLRRPLRRPNLYVCARCARLQPPSSAAPSRTTPDRQSRPVHQSTLEKRYKAELQWKERRRQIDAGAAPSMLRTLEERGFIAQVAGGRDELETAMSARRLGAYVGIDPTAPSLHVGHMLPLMALFWMYVHGFRAVSLIGGATAGVGDPTDRTAAREPMDTTTRRTNIVGLHYQLKKMWLNVDAKARKYGFNPDDYWSRVLVNNSMWLNKVSVVDFMKMGQSFRLGAMLSRETVKKRLSHDAKSDGMSYAEFSYPLLQAWDWWHLYSSPRGVQLQIGGSDQFGNIVAGIDAVKHMRRRQLAELPQQPADPLPTLTTPSNATFPADEPMGFTVPLLTTAAGAKFGKSEGNAVWLDGGLTSPFELYQFFLRAADADVERYLKLLTFVPLARVADVVREHAKAPEKRVAQHLLAFEFVELVHGTDEARKAEAQHRGIFGGGGGGHRHTKASDAPAPASSPDPSSGSDSPAPAQPDTAPYTLNALPQATLALSTLRRLPFSGVLTELGLAPSRSAATRLIAAGGAYVGAPDDRMEVNWRIVRDAAGTGRGEAVRFVRDGVLLVRTGKWRVRVVRVVEDGEGGPEGLAVEGAEGETMGVGEEPPRERQDVDGMTAWSPGAGREGKGGKMGGRRL